jgi:predicted nucleotidyltransferase
MFKLNSKIEITILGYFFINDSAKKYINELAKILKVNPANLDKKLKELEKEGVLASETSGNQKYFYLNKRYPLLKEVKKIYNAKYGLEKLLTQSLGSLKNLEEIYIFGSYAKNQLEAESDIDLLLIGSHSSLEAKRKIASLQDYLQREINIVDMTRNDFKQRQKIKDEFITNIFKNKIIKIM